MGSCLRPAFNKIFGLAQMEEGYVRTGYLQITLVFQILRDATCCGRNYGRDMSLIGTRITKSQTKKKAQMLCQSLEREFLLKN